MIERRSRAGGRTVYRVRWYAPDGRERSKTFPTLRDAKAFDAERLTGGDRWASPAAGSVRLASVWRRYIDTQTQLKSSTKYGYERMWGLYVAPTFGDWPVNRIKFADISTWVSDIAAKWSPATTRKAHRILALVLSHAVAEQLIAANPAIGVKLPSPKAFAARAADVATVERLAAAVRAPADDLVRFLAYTGLRWGEATALRLHDIDLSRRRIHVTRAHVDIGGRLVPDTPKSSRSRIVPIASPLHPMLESKLAGESDDLVFTTSTGSPWRSSNFKRDSRWATATAEAGIPGFRVHDLRHTAASLMIEAGANVVDVAAVLGHASSHTTLTIYAHMLGGRLDTVGAMLGDRIRSAYGPDPAQTVARPPSGQPTKGRN